MARDDANRLPADPVIEYYKKDIDRTLLRENLKLTPEARVLKLQGFVAALHQLHEARRRSGS
jgi:hypothetical protein